MPIINLRGQFEKVCSVAARKLDRIAETMAVKLENPAKQYLGGLVRRTPIVFFRATPAPRIQTIITAQANA